MENIIIDNFNFTTLEPMKYWSFPRTYNHKQKQEEAKYMCLSGNFIGSRKYDGAWNMLIKDNDGNFHLRSRTESVNGGYTDKAEWIPWITKALCDIPNGTVLLGEICYPNNEGSRKITSVLNCLKDKCIERQKKNGILSYYIFDVLAYNGKSIINEPISNRIKYIPLIKSVVPTKDIILYANYVEGEELWDLYGKTIASGGEGIVITRKDCQYLMGKRTARMTLKMKKSINETIDAFIDGHYKSPTREYIGKTPLETYSFWENVKTGEISLTNKFNEYIKGETWEPVTRLYALGYAGSIRFSVMKDGEEVPIGYISGVVDEIKKNIIKTPEEYYHKVFEISAMEVENIDGNYSLRHGVIIQERPDKNYMDCDFSQIANAQFVIKKAK